MVSKTSISSFKSKIKKHVQYSNIKKHSITYAK